METARKGELFVMPWTEERKYTIADIEALPEGKRAELIDGELYMMAAPNTLHQRLVREITYQILSYIKSNKGACEIFPAPFAVFLNADDRNYVEPDISVICDRSKLTDKGCNGAPDWIIEIVSDSSRSMDYNTKLFKYRTAGVREYWIVDPDMGKIMVNYFEQDTMKDYDFSDKVKVGIYEGFQIDFSDIAVS